MAVTLKIYDQTNTHAREPAVTLRLVSQSTTAEQLIVNRVQQEVEHFNSKKPELFSGLVQPTDAERTLNGGYRLPQGKTLDCEKQVRAALKAFEAGRFYLLVDDRQVEDLTEAITVTADTDVVFLKLVPLVGG